MARLLGSSISNHAGQSAVLVRRRKRRSEIAELLAALPGPQRTGAIYVAWANASTHHDDEIEAVVRGAAGRLVVLHSPLQPMAQSD